MTLTLSYAENGNSPWTLASAVTAPAAHQTICWTQLLCRVAECPCFHSFLDLSPGFPWYHLHLHSFSMLGPELEVRTAFALLRSSWSFGMTAEKQQRGSSHRGVSTTNPVSLGAPADQHSVSISVSGVHVDAHCQLSRRAVDVANVPSLVYCLTMWTDFSVPRVCNPTLKVEA